MEAGRAIVKGAAAARGAGRGPRGPRRRGPARGGRESGARTEEPAEERGEGGLPGEGRAGGGKKGRGRRVDGECGGSPRKRSAREWSCEEGGLREVQAPFADVYLTRLYPA